MRRGLSRTAVMQPALTTCILLTAAAVPALGEEGAPQSPVSVKAVIVEPTGSEQETLCRLKVRLHNAESRMASLFGFEVSVNGQVLPVYADQLFYFRLDAGTTAEFALYNFWSSESGRPAPADGKLEVRVTLKEAMWMDVSVDQQGAETWDPLGAIEGLPASSETTIQLK